MDKTLSKEEAQKDLDEMSAERREAAKKEAEARDAATASPAEIQKTKEKEEAEKKAQADKEAAKAQAKEDERILATKDEDLKEEEKTHKAGLLKKQQDRADAEAKEQAEEDKRILEAKNGELDEEERTRKGQLLDIKKQEKLDARFGELTGKIKDLEKDKVSNKAEIDKLKGELGDLEKKHSGPSDAEIVAEIKKTEGERIKKYIEEDKDKPREQRREMPEEELEEFLLENLRVGQEWLAERSVRRIDERKQDYNKKRTEDFAKNFVEKQRESSARTEATHPELNTDAREKELEGQGKSVEAIHKILCEENPKYKLCAEIFLSDPKKYSQTENGPELIVAEMEKQLNLKPDDKTDELNATIARLEQEKEDLETEVEKIKNTDVGINSNVGPIKKGKSQPLDTYETALVDTMKSNGAPQASIDSALAKYRKKKGK